MPNLISLQRLYIRYCPRITKVSSALRHLTFLEILVFVACEELDFSDSEYHSDMPWQHLRRLLFVNLFKLASLPKGLQHVLTLRKLTIYNCPNLSLYRSGWEVSLNYNIYGLENVLNCQKDAKTKWVLIGPRLLTSQILASTIDGFNRMLLQTTIRRMRLLLGCTATATAYELQDGDTLSSFIHEILMKGIALINFIYEFYFSSHSFLPAPSPMDIFGVNNMTIDLQRVLWKYFRLR
ncbi:hypothetical protein GH714_015712 [Hevea brasiliensis]|uniref:Uncharacterized protein n=1 Tax=Hevea brasiliensis TaxID=3981 RepID=A0A6A6N150_HEVBR|nr:hypothetical protein GH714_015712 [Hevea brasiliensis]